MNIAWDILKLKNYLLFIWHPNLIGYVIWQPWPVFIFLLFIETLVEIHSDGLLGSSDVFITFLLAILKCQLF